MSTFSGTQIHKVDTKGRLSVPAKYRAHIQAQGSAEVVLFASTEEAYPAIFGFPPRLMDQLSRNQREMKGLSPEAAMLMSDVFAEAYELAFDDAGRIVLPKLLIAFGGIDGQAEIVGQGQHFEIWKPGGFREHRRNRLDSVLRQLFVDIAEKL